MSTLFIVGTLCFAIALVLPAYESHGFLKIRGTGLKMLWFSLVLMVLGCVALFKDANEKVFLYFLPGLLNLLALSLMFLGLYSIHSPFTRVLGGILLSSTIVLFPLLLLRSRDVLKIGSYFWFIACALLSTNVVWSWN